MKKISLIVTLLLTASPVWAVGSPVRLDGGDTITALSDVTVTTTATLIAASNSNRAALNCTTDAQVRWGSSAITATKGQVIVSSGSIEIRNTAAVYMIVESGTANVTCTEESWESVSSGSGIFSP